MEWAPQQKHTTVGNSCMTYPQLKGKKKKRPYSLSKNAGSPGRVSELTVKAKLKEWTRGWRNGHFGQLSAFLLFWYI